MKPPTLRQLAENWKLKLAALALAVLLWSVVSAEQVTTQWLPIPVEVQVLDPSQVLVEGPEPPEVSVRFAGPGRELWELALNRPVLTLPVTEVGNGRIYVLEPQMVRLPSGLSATALDVRPGTVRLSFQPIATREVPVRVQVGTASMRRWVLADSLEVAPTTVRVSGPAEVVDAIEGVRTRPITIATEDSVFALRVALDTADLEGVRLSVGQVRVSGRVDRRVERTVDRVPVVPPAGTAVSPAQGTVVVQGAEPLVTAMDGALLRLGVPPDSLPPVLGPEGVELPLVVRGLPPGVRAAVDPARVRVLPAGLPAPDTAPAPGEPPPEPAGEGPP